MKRHIPLLNKMMKKIAPCIGATVIIEPEWNIVGQIIYKSGKKRYFRGSTIDINTVGASDIAKDKDYAKFFMEKMGYSIVEGRTFYSDKWAKAIGSNETIDAGYRYAVKLGFPVIVKPNSGSQGSGFAKVFNKTEFYRMMKSVFEKDRVALIERVILARDYRIVVLDGKVISAYERIPLTVVGDGKSSIRTLLRKKQKTFIASGRDTVLNINDPRIVLKLRHSKMSLSSVLGKGRSFQLLDNANLSTGGESIDVTDTIHPDYRALAIRLTRDMGLRLCGVDLLVEGEIDRELGTHWILEVNAAPGLDHYAASGAKQNRIVEKMYTEVLRAMET